MVRAEGHRFPLQTVKFMHSVASAPSTVPMYQRDTATSITSTKWNATSLCLATKLCDCKVPKSPIGSLFGLRTPLPDCVPFKARDRLREGRRIPGRPACLQCGREYPAGRQGPGDLFEPLPTGSSSAHPPSIRQPSPVMDNGFLKVLCS